MTRDVKFKHDVAVLLKAALKLPGGQALVCNHEFTRVVSQLNPKADLGDPVPLFGTTAEVDAYAKGVLQDLDHRRQALDVMRHQYNLDVDRQVTWKLKLRERLKLLGQQVADAYMLPGD